MSDSPLAPDDADDAKAYPLTRFMAIMSLPREGPLDTKDCIYNALLPYGIPLKSYSPPFWEQGIQNSMEQAVADKTDVIITFDYDSIFSREDFDAMFHTFMSNPQIDALAPMQPKRGNGRLMFSTEGDYFNEKGVTGPTIVGSLLKASSAHFGMTFIRVAKIATLPKPWLVNVPNSKGSWGAPLKEDDPRCDSDCYFWKQWRDAGHSLFVHTGVYLGHLERLVAQFVIEEIDGALVGTTKHFYLSDWLEGKRVPVAVARKKESLQNLKLGDFTEDKYPQLFQQCGQPSGEIKLGEPSTDLSGSRFANVE